MASAKQIALDVVRALPDDCTLEEAAYRLRLRQLVEEGRDDIREGRVFTQEEVEREADTWLGR
jgi:predicted transcriptional regulator